MLQHFNLSNLLCDSRKFAENIYISCFESEETREYYDALKKGISNLTKIIADQEESIADQEESIADQEESIAKLNKSINLIQANIISCQTEASSKKLQDELAKKVKEEKTLQSNKKTLKEYELKLKNRFKPIDDCYRFLSIVFIAASALYLFASLINHDLSILDNLVKVNMSDKEISNIFEILKNFEKRFINSNVHGIIAANSF